MRSITILLLLASSVAAQPPLVPKDGKVIIPLTITPAAVKHPLSRYYLTPQYPDMRPGNRVQTFMRSRMEQTAFFSKEPSELRTKWNDMKLEDLPVEEIRKSGCIGGLAYRAASKEFMPGRGRPLGDVDEGARQLSSDWQIWHSLREDGIGTLLPDIQHMRELATVLKVRMRYEIRTGDIEKAIYSSQTFYGLATGFETHPTFIGMLVGVAIEAINLNTLEELIQHPNCPNLYWSFTEIPLVVFNPRICFGGEPLISAVHFQAFMDAKEPMSQERVQRELERIDKLEGYADPSDRKAPKFSQQIAVKAKDEAKRDAAKKLLIDTGMDATLVGQMPPLQLMATADIRQYEVLLREILAVQNLPHHEAIKRADSIQKRIKTTGSVMADWLLPSIAKVKVAHTRTVQRVAFLRVIEAIRLYAHEHNGQLPAKLSDCSVPLPLDPATDQPFSYSVTDGVATLSGTDTMAPPPGDTDPAKKPTGVTNRHYEIRIRK